MAELKTPRDVMQALLDGKRIINPNHPNSFLAFNLDGKLKHINLCEYIDDKEKSR